MCCCCLSLLLLCTRVPALIASAAPALATALELKYCLNCHPASRPLCGEQEHARR